MNFKLFIFLFQLPPPLLDPVRQLLPARRSRHLWHRLDDLLGAGVWPVFRAGIKGALLLLHVRPDARLAHDLHLHSAVLYLHELPRGHCPAQANCPLWADAHDWHEHLRLAACVDSGDEAPDNDHGRDE